MERCWQHTARGRIRNARLGRSARLDIIPIGSLGNCGMTVLGVAACAIGAYSTADAPPLYMVTMGALVFVATVTAILGLIFGSKTYAIVLAATIVVLWAIATVRHVFMKAI